MQRILPASPETVWNVLLAWEAQPRWMKDADSVRVLGPNREGVGVRIAVRTRVFNVPLFTEDLSLPIPLLGEVALRVYRPFMRHLMRGALDGLAAYVGSVET